MAYLDRFHAQVNSDLNLPRAVALTWELVESSLPTWAKKATLLEFDRVLGLRLSEWEPPQVVMPGEIMALVQQRQRARADRRWQEADALRDRIAAAVPLSSVTPTATKGTPPTTTATETPKPYTDRNAHPDLHAPAGRNPRFPLVRWRECQHGLGPGRGVHHGKQRWEQR